LSANLAMSDHLSRAGALDQSESGSKHFISPTRLV